MLPSSSEIKYFLEVASTLNISRAAERLGISQPSLSVAIHRLEEAVGAPLLVRTKGGVQLTKAGTKFTMQARSLMEEWNRLKKSVSDDEQVGGRFTIGCHPSVALYALPHFLTELMESNTNLEITLQHDLSRKITENVISFRTDFGIVVNPTKHPDLVIKRLMTDEVTFWAGPRKNATNEAKSEGAVLVCDEDLMQTQSLLKSARKSQFDFRRVITSSNLEVIAALVASGCGVGILPERVALRVASYGLKRIGLPVFSDEVCLVYRADTQRTKTSKLIVDVIQKNLR